MEKVKRIICSYENARKLHELGILQNSVFYFVDNWVNPAGFPIDNGQHVILHCEKHMTRIKTKDRLNDVSFISAFTATELGAFLPYGNDQSCNADDLATKLIDHIKDANSMFSVLLVEHCNERFKNIF